MADQLLLLYQQASFRGFGFFFKNAEATRGRKTVVYDYPLTDKRYIQDLGQYSRVYRMTCRIVSQDVDYQVRTQLFKAILERKGSGILIHPLDGAVLVQVKTYTLVEGIDTFGYAEFEVTFCETTAEAFPTPTQVLEASIAGLLTGFTNIWRNFFPTKYQVSQSNSGNFQYSNEVLLPNTADQFTDLPSLAPSSSSDQLSSFTNSLNNFNDNFVKNSLNGQSLVDDLNDLINLSGDLSSVIDERLAVIQSLFNFSPAPVIVSDTIVADEREQNRLTIQQYVNSLALMYAYTFITAQTFDTEQDVEDQSQVLSDQYTYIVLNNTFKKADGSTVQILDDELFTTLQKARVQAHNFLATADTQAKKVLTVDVKRNSLIPFVYDYYDNLNNLELINDLNQIVNPCNISGQLKVVTDQVVDELPLTS